MQLYINYIGKNKAWDLASLPSSIHNFKMNLIWCPRSHKISPLSFQQHCIFLSMFLTQLSVDVFFTKLQHSGGRSVCTAAAPHNTPQNTSCGQDTSQPPPRAPQPGREPWNSRSLQNYSLKTAQFRNLGSFYRSQPSQNLAPVEGIYLLCFGNPRIFLSSLAWRPR